MSTVKKILALIACLALILMSAGVCFADTDEGYFVPVQTLTASSSSFSNALMKCFTAYFGADSGLAVSTTQDYEGLVVIFRYPNSNANYPDKFCMVSHNYFDYQILNGEYWGSFSNLATVPSSSVGNFTVSGDLYYTTAYYNNSYSSITYNPDIMRFTTLEDGLAWAESALFTTYGEVVHFTLEPGYAYVIEGACEVSDRTFSLTGSSNLSTLSNKNGSVQWFGSVGNIRDGFSPDLNNSDNLVVWSPLNSNPSGEASNYSYHATDVINVSSGGAYVISYPLYYGSKYVPTGASAVIQNSVNMSGSVYIQYSGDRPTMRRVALKSEQSYSDNFISYYNTFQPSVLNETVTYTVSDDVVTVDPSTAPVGGADAGTPSEDVDTTILGVLQRFINNISGLISSGSHAIAELVTLGSSFMMSIAAMYQWLPSGLTTLIITAFTIVLVIGVIKLLWK